MSKKIDKNVSGPAPYVRRTGRGPYVLCLHSSTASSKQWNRLAEKLSDEHTVVAPDLYGYGESPAWDEKRPLELEDEVELLAPVLDSIPGPFHLVGHSYGGAVAFRLAMVHPDRVRSLVAYEPVLFNLLFQLRDFEAAREIWSVHEDVFSRLDKQRDREAAERFVDYWSGEGSFARLPEWQQAAIVKRMRKVRDDFDATLGNLTPASAFENFQVPTLFLYGLQSPLSTRRLADWLGRRLPRAEVRGLLPLGHMGPVTHANEISDMIIRFLKGQPSGIALHRVHRTS